MVPPQDRPTFQAVSSATPNSSILGLPLSITSIASVTTAPSTQPPDTDPRKLPSLSMTRFEPTGRGADPHVSTTVASATSRPSLRHSSAALRISSSRESIEVLHHATCFSRSFGLYPFAGAPDKARTSSFIESRLWIGRSSSTVSYTHLRAHETPEHLVCRLL